MENKKLNQEEVKVNKADKDHAKKVKIAIASLVVAAIALGVILFNRTVNPFDEMIVLNEDVKVEEKSKFDGTKDEDIFLFVNKEEFEKLELEEGELTLTVENVDTDADVDKEHIAKVIAIYKDKEFEKEVPYSIEKVTIEFKDVKEEYKYTIGDKLDYKDTIKATASNKDEVKLDFSKIDESKAGTTEVTVTASTENGIKETKKFKVTLKEKPKPKPAPTQQQPTQGGNSGQSANQGWQPAPSQPAPQQPAPAPAQPAPAPQEDYKPLSNAEREAFLKRTQAYQDSIAEGWKYYGFYPTQDGCKSAMHTVGAELLEEMDNVSTQCILNSHIKGGILMYK